jgi:hypothetical protein
MRLGVEVSLVDAVVPQLVSETALRTSRNKADGKKFIPML